MDSEPSADGSRIDHGLDEMMWLELDVQLSSVFTPAVPVSENDLFTGRINEIRRVVGAVNQRGQHAIVYGERGVGKTSLANVLSSRLLSKPKGSRILSPRITCDTTDDYATLWRKVFAEVDLIQKRKTPAPGLTYTLFDETRTASEVVPDFITPDDVRRLLTFMSDDQIVVIILDEFDRLTEDGVRRAMADTIKVLSDHDVRATIVIVGVGDTVGELIAEHQSIQRALIQVQMPRMDPSELHEFLEKGTSRIGMRISEEAKTLIANLSQGLPHYTHTLALHAGHIAIDHRRLEIQATDIKPAITKALADAQQSLTEDYRKAITSPQKGNLYSRVLLACALAKTDRFGYFAAADVRGPLSDIMGEKYDIPIFAKHLNGFTQPERGAVLKKTGESYRFKYRFSDPLMQPFVIMQGIAAGLINTVAVNA